MYPLNRTDRLKRLVLVLGLIPPLIIILGIHFLGRAPYLGIDYSLQGESWRIVAIDNDGPARELADVVGARIVAIAGEAVGRYSLVRHPDDIPGADEVARWRNFKAALAQKLVPGETVDITVEDAARQRHYALTPVAMPAAVLAGKLATLIIACLAWLLMGLTVALQRPFDPAARLLFFLSLVMSANFLSYTSYASQEFALNGGAYRLFLLINSVCSAYLPAVFLHFFLVFPTPWPVTRKRWFAPLLYGLPLVVAAIYHSRLWFPALYLELAGGFLLGMAVLIYRFVTSRDTKPRAQLRWVMWGTSLFVLSIVGLNIVPVMVLGRSLASDWAIPIVLTLLPLSIAIAIMRHQVMDLETLFDNTLAYVITLGLLAGMDFALVSALGRLDAGLVDIPGYVPALAGVWLIVLLYVPLRQRVHRAIKRLLKRDDYRPDEVTLRLGQALMGMDDMGATALTARQFIIDTLHPRATLLYLLDESGMPHGHGEEGERPAWQTLAARLQGLERATPLHRLAPPLSPQEQAILLGRHSDAVLVPVRQGEELLGGMLLNDKQSGGLYGAKDLQLLDWVARYLLLVSDRIRGRLAAGRERERIYSDLHDDVGAKLLSLSYRSADGDSAELARSALQDLRDVVSRSSRDNLTLISALADWRIETSDRLEDAEIDLSWRQAGDLPDPPLAPEQIMNMGRILREAVSNIIRHAQADAVAISINAHADAVHISIENDGIDYDPSAWKRGRGIQNMTARAEALGGEVCWEHRAPTGTRIRWWFPCVLLSAEQ